MLFDKISLLKLIAAVVGVYAASAWFKAAQKVYRLRHIPTVGPSGVFMSYFGAWRYYRHANEIVEEGYKKFGGRPFKIANMSRWLVIVSGRDMLDDVARANDDILNMDEAFAESAQTDYTIGEVIRKEHYHLATLRHGLTRNMGICFEDIRDEIEVSFLDLLPMSKSEGESEWTLVPLLSTTMKVVFRATNRVFVGLPLCRDAGYMQLNFEFTSSVFKAGSKIKMLPGFLKPIAGWVLSALPIQHREMMSYVGRMIQERLDKEKEKEHEDEGDEMESESGIGTDTLVNWLVQDSMKEGLEHQKTVEDLTRRLMHINFTANSTTSDAFTHAMHNLLLHPEYQPVLRDEAQEVIREYGWSKAAMDSMDKMDSFLKESQRIAAGEAQIIRRVMKNHTFSSGLFVPAGTDIAVATRCTHMDESIYANPHEFDGYRFLKMRRANEHDHDHEESTKHRMLSISPEYLAFGIGRHACPGRVLAVYTLKCMLAHMLVHYEVKFAHEGVVGPNNVWLHGRLKPSLGEEVLIMRRGTEGKREKR